jgi:hypothetical protein
MSFHSRPPVDAECVEQYRRCVVDIDLPNEEIDALIGIVHSILSFFVDQAFGVLTDQITLRSIGSAFSSSLGHATIKDHLETQSARVKGYGVKGDSDPLGPTEP